jgi:hypothetical protein
MDPLPAHSVPFPQTSATVASCRVLEVGAPGSITNDPTAQPRAHAEPPLLTTSSMEPSPLSTLLDRMSSIDPTRGSAYRSAYGVLEDSLVGPDVIIELGCMGLERLGLKAGVAARILMEVKREALEAAGKKL